MTIEIFDNDFNESKKMVMKLHFGSNLVYQQLHNFWFLKFII